MSYLRKTKKDFECHEYAQIIVDRAKRILKGKKRDKIIQEDWTSAYNDYVEVIEWVGNSLPDYDNVAHS